MGTTYYAQTFIGIPIDGEKLFTIKKVKAFKHDYPADWVCDPKDRRPLWKEVKKYLPHCNGYSKLGKYELTRTVGGVDVYVAFKIHEINFSNCFKHIPTAEIEAMVQIKKEMKKYLEPKGMWKEEDFGIYTLISYC